MSDGPHWQARSKASGPAVLGILLLVAGCGSSNADESATPATPVRVAVAESEDGLTFVSGTGTTAFEREATLSFRIGGVLKALNVDVGDRLAVGQHIGRLAGDDVDAQAVGRLAEVQRAERTLKRLEGLAETGAIAAADARDQRDVLRQARAAMAAARYDQRSASLSSPFTGIVLERLTQVGETLTAGQAVLRVADTRSGSIVRVSLTPADANRIKPGAVARVSFAPGRSTSGRVSRLQAAVSDSTGTRIVEVRLDVPSAHSGTLATVKIATRGEAVEHGAVKVPAEALVPRPDGTVGIYTVTKQQRAQFRPARLLRFEDDVAILSGISAGTRAITSGSGYLKDGDAVLLSGDGA